MATLVARSEKLKERMTDHQITKIAYKTQTKACIERARYLTESFRETEGQPMVIRRAKALARYLEKKTLFITEGDLIVGAAGKDTNSIPFYPENNVAERLKTDIIASHMLTPEEWQECDEITDYWKGKTLEEVCLAAFPEEVKAIVHPPQEWRLADSHHYQHPFIAPTPDLEMLLSTGLNGIIKKI